MPSHQCVKCHVYLTLLMLQSISVPIPAHWWSLKCLLKRNARFKLTLAVTKDLFRHGICNIAGFINLLKFIQTYPQLWRVTHAIFAIHATVTYSVSGQSFLSTTCRINVGLCFS